MERWYIGIRTRSSPIDLTQNLGRLVRHYSLGDFITRACYERRSAHKRTSEYYYFLGVVSDEKGYIPEEKYQSFYSALHQLGVHDSGIYVYYDEIQPMASKEIEAFNFRQIKMVQPDKYLPTDPFDLAVSPEDSPYSTEDTKPAFNQLLFYLSSYGRGTWQQFRMICAELELDSTGDYARRISRRLRSLGHIELSSDGQNWFVAPSCMVQLGGENQQYQVFLAGQRSPQLLESLQQETYGVVSPQPYGNAPEQVLLTFPDEFSARSFADDYSRQHHPLYLAGQAGLKIASILPSLDEWEATLPLLSIVKGHYHFERWVDGAFESVHLPRENGMYRLTHNSDRFAHPQLTLYYNAEADNWRRADWYGIRFLALRRTGISCDVHYDSARQELAISLNQRWPDLYERSLVLASGQLPGSHNSRAIYTNISATQAHILASKLGANLIEHGGT